MGPKAVESDSQAVAENVIENILDEVTRFITERIDSCFNSFESLKLQTFGSEDILDFGCSRRESCGKAKDEEYPKNFNSSFRYHFNDIRYQTLADTSEGCVHPVSKSSKQGEGDFQHPMIREAVAFYRLDSGEEENRPGRSKAYRSCFGPSLLVEDLDKVAEKCDDNDQIQNSQETEQEGNCLNVSKERKNSWSCATSPSSMATETSHEELMEDLHRNINNASFDDVHLSDSDDCSPVPQSVPTGSDTPVKTCTGDEEGCACLSDDQGVLQHDAKVPNDHSDDQTCLHQSKKFCQFNNVNFFHNNDIPPNYCQLVNESYDKFESIAKEEDEQALLSDGSSEELVIIESDEIDQNTAGDCYPQRNTFKHTFLCSVAPSTTVLSQLASNKSTDPPENKNRITVVADIEPPPRRQNWEENLEVQVNVTEPLTLTELEEDGQDCEFVKTRKYWTSAGLMTEKIVSPKYVAFLNDDSNGIESVPGMTRVTASRRKRDRQAEDEILTMDEVNERDANEKLNQSFGGHGQIKFENLPKQNHQNVYTQSYGVEFEHSKNDTLGNENKGKYKNFAEEAERKGKKKNKFVSRLTKSLTNLFRSKKKNPK